jgi:hypothetical protein
MEHGEIQRAAGSEMTRRWGETETRREKARGQMTEDSWQGQLGGSATSGTKFA